MGGESVRLGSLDDFPLGEGVRVEVDELPTPLAVFRLDDGFYALPDSCPHKGAPLSRAGTEPKDADDRGTRGKLDSELATVSCPWHGLEFDLETGDCPATRYRVRSFDVFETDGDVTLRL